MFFFINACDTFVDENFCSQGTASFLLRATPVKGLSPKEKVKWVRKPSAYVQVKATC